MNNRLEKIRIDKWLWAVRFFKSRSIAAEACGKSKIMVGDQAVKPSRTIKIGDAISIRKGAFTTQFEVLQLTENRIPAKGTSDFYKDITSPAELEKIKMHAIQMGSYPNRHEGRPTKKNRRELDEFIDF